MLGIVLILGVSWLLIYYIQKENLLVLGFTPLKKSLAQFAVGLFFIIILKLGFIYIDTHIKSVVWANNASFTYGTLFQSFWYHLKSALTEDLIFRGALLYVLLKRMKVQWALLISATAFGVYHWFSFGMLGSGIVPLIYVFITTGFTGYAWGYTFHTTKSVMMPLGFHLGWNFIITCFYKSQPYGELIFKEVSKKELSEWNNLYYALFIGIMPSLLTLIFVRLLSKKKFI